MEFFVKPDSIVRRIWGDADTVMFIFAGAAAEFALNKAVDWLYFTGRLPSDPLGRLFSTVEYAKLIVFSDLENANKSIDKITAIHEAVEYSRNSKIPDWAYRDVLYMLIDYSIRSYEVLYRPMTIEEKSETFDVFYRVGKRMGLKDLPTGYDAWTRDREEHMRNNLINSYYTTDLFKKYKDHLGTIRYFILRESQKLVLPQNVRSLLRMHSFSYMSIGIRLYKFLRMIRLNRIFRDLILPARHLKQVRGLDVR